MIRNTSVILKWMPLPLEEHCNDIVITFPPVIFGVDVEYGEASIPGYPIVSIPITINFLCSLLCVPLQYTFETEHKVDGLRPFTKYEVDLSISNMYTLRGSYIDKLFSIGIRFTTREGGIIRMSHIDLDLINTFRIQFQIHQLECRSQYLVQLMFKSVGQCQILQP